MPVTGHPRAEEILYLKVVSTTARCLLSDDSESASCECEAVVERVNAVVSRVANHILSHLK